jgi:hypothetical protein
VLELVEKFSREGTFTLFARTNYAFSILPAENKAKLISVLNQILCHENLMLL